MFVFMSRKKKKKEKNHKTLSQQPRESWETRASTYSSFEDVVVDVVGAALRAGEGETLAVFVALFVGQLERNSQHAISLFLPLVLLLSPELTRVQTWHGRNRTVVYITGRCIFRFSIIYLNVN